MKENFVADWAFGITGAIEYSIRRNFPQEVRRWPLLGSFYAEAYELPERHMLIVLKDKLSDIPHISAPEPFPYADPPTLPPKIEDVEFGKTEDHEGGQGRAGRARHCQGPSGRQRVP